MTEKIVEIINKLSIEDYLDQECIEYKKTHGSSGEQLNVRCCPACGSDGWKVFLNVETGLGNCFSGDCEIKYNKYKFISKHTDLVGAPLHKYIQNLGIAMGWRAPRTKSTAVNLDVAELKLPTSYEIPIQEKNLQYLKNRNIAKEVAKYFNLRYCEKGWFKYLSNGQERFMNFAGRIIIPVFDLDGNLVSFQGRDITGLAEKKYLFPPGFAVTGKHLYNGHNVTATTRVLIGEGAFDVFAQKIALDEDETLRDVVPIGTFGKHLSEDQIQRFGELKNRGVKEVTFMWDSEVSALDSAVIAGNALKNRFGLNVRISTLPKGKDPNEVAPIIVRQAFWSAIPLTIQNAVKLKMFQRAMQ